MVILCATVLLGTICPLLVEVFTKNKISVGEPYFNSTVIPIIIPAILLMGIGPILSWEKENSLKILKKIYPKILLTIISTVIIFSICSQNNVVIISIRNHNFAVLRMF